MLLETKKHPGELKDMVTSPAGKTLITISVIIVLFQKFLWILFSETIRLMYLLGKGSDNDLRSTAVLFEVPAQCDSSIMV